MKHSRLLGVTIFDQRNMVDDKKKDKPRIERG